MAEVFEDEEGRSYVVENEKVNLWNKKVKQLCKMRLKGRMVICYPFHSGMLKWVEG